MRPGQTIAEYSDAATTACERVLVTLIGSVGKWASHLYLVGGLVPRYLVPQPRAVEEQHVGSTDVDIAIIIAVDDANAYTTLERELKNLEFKQAPGPDGSDYQWGKVVDGVSVLVEFISEAANVEPGRSLKVRGKTGSGFQAFNVPGVHVVERDYVERTVIARRFDTDGSSSVQLRVPNVLPYLILKITAYQDRHKNKDAYDIVWLLLNYGDGPADAGASARESLIRRNPTSASAMELLRARFADVAQDAPRSYATFLGDGLDDDGVARLELEAVTAVELFLTEFERDGFAVE